MMRTRYAGELESVRQNLIAMGETTSALLAEGLRAVADPSPECAEKASELEARTDHQHRLIHDQCLNLITLQAPVARDARLITGALDAIVDLELIGDYAYEIVLLAQQKQGRPPSQILFQISDIGARIGEILSAAIDSWRNADRNLALSASAWHSARMGATRGRAERARLRSAVRQLSMAADRISPILAPISDIWNRI